MALKYEHRIGVSVPAEVVWEVLADLPRWSRWSGIYTKVEGKLAYDADLQIDQAIPGEPAHLTARIVDWTPLELLHWRRSLFRGWVTAIRYFEIEQLDNDACIISNGEMYLGRLAPWLIKGRRRDLKAAFAKMGEGLKAQAEAKWSAMPESRIEKAPSAPRKKAQPSISLQPAPSPLIRAKLKFGGRS